MVAVGIFFAFASRAYAQDARTRLRPGDALRIEVRDEPQFSGEFPIGQDGQILLPVLGTVRVADLPFSEVDSVLRKRITGELVDPVIRITPLLRIAVLGEVRAPGLFLVDPTFSAADILARAGGLTPMAREKGIELRRQDGQVAARFDVRGAIQPVTVASGDQIFVSRRNWISTNLGILLSAGGSVAVALITAALVR